MKCKFISNNGFYKITVCMKLHRFNQIYLFLFILKPLWIQDVCKNLSEWWQQRKRHSRFTVFRCDERWIWCLAWMAIPLQVHTEIACTWWQCPHCCRILPCPKLIKFSPPFNRDEYCIWSIIVCQSAEANERSLHKERLHLCSGYCRYLHTGKFSTFSITPFSQFN